MGEWSVKMSVRHFVLSDAVIFRRETFEISQKRAHRGVGKRANCGEEFRDERSDEVSSLFAFLVRERVEIALSAI